MSWPPLWAQQGLEKRPYGEDMAIGWMWRALFFSGVPVGDIEALLLRLVPALSVPTSLPLDSAAATLKGRTDSPRAEPPACLLQFSSICWPNWLLGGQEQALEWFW